MFSGDNNNVLVLGGSFQEYHFPTPTAGFERLGHAASPSAFHNSRDIFDQPKCHPKTRLAVLERITNWIDGVEEPNASVMWVSGGAGVGKSAIARTMAECLALEKRLLASFFFSRSDSSRNNANRLVPSLVYHAALHIPLLREPIIQAVDRDPLIFQLSLNAQFFSLLTAPVLALSESGYFDSPSSSSCPRVIVIDGLDECEDRTAQVTILNEISNALRKGNLPLKFLIASRPEHHLSATFTSGNINKFHTRLTLDDSFFPEHDIQFFLEDQFEELKTIHPFREYLPPFWPDSGHIQTLVRKSTGQFIYASTVIKYISSLRHRPNHRLDVILGLRPSRNETLFPELDALYTHIFSSIDPEAIELVLDILALTILKTYAGSPAAWTVAETESFLLLEPGDVQIALCDLRSIVCTRTGYGGAKFIDALHASLSDFLFDPSRSTAFYINSQLRHAAFAHRYFELFKVRDYILPYEWHSRLAEHCSKASLTLELQQDILDFSFLRFRACFYDRPDMDKVDLALFIIEFLKAMESTDLVYDHILQIIDEYLMVYLRNYYSDAPHTFLVALVGIRAHWDLQGRILSLGRPSAEFRTYLYNDGPHTLDDDNLNLFALLFERPNQQYLRYLRRFLGDPSRSGACVLDGKRYAVAALHSLKFLCNSQLWAPSTKQHKHAREIRRNWPWASRKRIGRNARALMRFRKRYLRRRKWSVFFAKPTGNPFEKSKWKGFDDYVRSRTIKWSLRCFRRFLDQSGGSKELFEFASRYSLPALIYQNSPRQARLATNAIIRYVDAWEGADIAV